MRNILIIVVLAVVLSVAAFGISRIAKPVQVAKDVTLEEVKDCKTVSWNETEDIVGDCTEIYKETKCTDEPLNKSCSVIEKSLVHKCRTGTNIIPRSKEVCTDKEFLLTASKLLGEKKYSLEYGDWGKCSYQQGDNYATIICDSKYDGNNDGICQSGESCVSFIISKDQITRMVRNSREDFAENDETFTQEKLSMEEI